MATSDTMEGPGAVGDELAAAELLANALKRMDGLIGDFRQPSPPPDDPLTRAIIETCEKLRSLIEERRREEGEGEGEGGRKDSRDAVPLETKELLAEWLTGKVSSEAAVSAEQLLQDKEELLHQVVSLQEQVEVGVRERDELRTRVEELEREGGERDAHCKALFEELKAAKATIEARDLELKQLQDEVQAGFRGNKGHTVTFAAGSERPPKHVTLREPMMYRTEVKRSSFKRSLQKAFGRKKTHTATLQPEEGGGGDAVSTQELSQRAAQFHAMDGSQVGEWVAAIGLDMYQELVEEKIPSGSKLVAIATAQSTQELIKVGILSTLHCKKLRLAVEEALSDHPSPLADLDHSWVSDWLKKIGLGCYCHAFLDGRIDGRMLNSISMEDLQLLDIVNPFHIISLKRAIQAFRMCGYNRDYLEESAGDKGSQKLLHWSAQRVAQWVQSVELDEYVGGLENAGIHGAVMHLDVQFTSDSLAKALGISSSQSLIRKHLSRKFMELIGPTAAQRKVDAMQSKAFAPLDPTEQAKGKGRTRSRSVGSRRGRNHGEETMLCPLDEFPAAIGSYPHLAISPPPPRPATP